MKRQLGVVLAAASLGLACGETGRQLPFYDSPDFTPRWDVSPSQPFHEIRPFELVDQRGEAFTEQDLAGRIAVADFFFATCPGICPRLAESMSRLQEEFATDDRVLLLSHSVMPETDTPEVLAQYAEDRGVEWAQWRLLTGARSEIYDLGKRYYFVDEDVGGTNAADEFTHTENLVLIDGQRRIRGIYNGLKPDSVRSLIADIGVLLGGSGAPEGEGSPRTAS